MPESSQWVVTFDYADEKANPKPRSANAPARIKKSVNVRSGPLTYKETTDEAGGKIEKWFLRDEQYTRKGGSPQFYIAGTKDIFNASFEPFSPTDFQGFSWISKKNFVGDQKIQGRDCLVYRDQTETHAVLDSNISATARAPQGQNPTNMTLPSEATGSGVTVVACIDKETRLPVTLQIGEETRTFTFLDPPTAPVTLPPDLKQQLEEQQKAWNDMTRPAPRPY